MTSPVNLKVVQWLRLCDQAEAVASGRDRDGHGDLVIAAGRLTTVHPLPYSSPDTALLTAFRWDCTAYGVAGVVTRVMLAPGVLAKAGLVRALLTPGLPTPQSVALPVPEPEVPAWTRRADIGG